MAPEYFIRRGSRVLGPLSTQALKDLAATGRLDADDEVSLDREFWIAARNVRGLPFADGSAGPCRSDRPADRPFDVFISYSHLNKLEADAICGKLESAGIRCWIAPRDIMPGTEWAEGIIDGIDRCRSMVLVFSEHANGSPQVRREVERAISKQLPLLPFRVQDTMPTRAMEYCLSNTHWLDAFHPPLGAHIERLAQALRRLLADDSRPSANPPTTPPRQPDQFGPERHDAGPGRRQAGADGGTAGVLGHPPASPAAAKEAGRAGTKPASRPLPRWAYFAIFSAVQLLVLFLIFRIILDPPEPVYYLEIPLVVWGVFEVVQYLFLSPVVRPRVKSGPGKPVWVWVSMGTAGLLAGVLICFALLLLSDFLWGLGVIPDDEVGSGMHPGIAIVVGISGLLLVLTSWIVSTPLLVAFMRKGEPERQLSRIAARIFLGSVVEVIAALPVLGMLKNKRACSSNTFSFNVGLFAIMIGTLMLGPMILLVILSRRSRAASHRRCAACGHDMSAVANRDRCPACGAGWSSPDSHSSP